MEFSSLLSLLSDGASVLALPLSIYATFKPAEPYNDNEKKSLIVN